MIGSPATRGSWRPVRGHHRKWYLERKLETHDKSDAVCIHQAEHNTRYLKPIPLRDVIRERPVRVDRMPPKRQVKTAPSLCRKISEPVAARSLLLHWLPNEAIALVDAYRGLSHRTSIGRSSSSATRPPHAGCYAPGRELETNSKFSPSSS